MQPENRIAPTLSAFAKRIFHYYRPHFGLGENKWRSVMGGLIIINSIIAAFCMSLINSAMNSFIGVLSVPGVTYSSYFGALGYFFGAILLHSVFSIANSWLGTRLAESLSNRINQKFVKKWLNNKEYYQAKIGHHINNLPNPAQIISYNNSELNNRTIELINCLLIVTGNFVVGAIGLYDMSIPLTLTLFSTPIVIPGYLLLSSVIYGLIYNTVTNKVGKSLQTHLDKETEVRSELYDKINHISTRAEHIAFLNGANYERQSLLTTLINNRLTQQSIAGIRSALTFLNMFSSNFTNIIAFILASPSILANKLQITQMFELANHFNFVVQLFTWKSDNFDRITECYVHLQKLEDLLSVPEKSIKISNPKRNNLVFARNQLDNIQITNLTVHKPDDTPILCNFNATFKEGEIILIKAESGRGKTSFLRALANIYPYANGSISGVPEKTYFLPSEPYFPYKKTLLDAIFYPKIDPTPSASELAQIKDLMRAMGLGSKIDDLTKVKDWYSTVLSDGERKRLMIIAAIMAKPALLIMDEATRGIDIPTKLIVEKLIKAHLPKTTILFTDHTPSEGSEKFYSRIIEPRFEQSQSTMARPSG